MASDKPSKLRAEKLVSSGAQPLSTVEASLPSSFRTLRRSSATNHANSYAEEETSQHGIAALISAFGVQPIRIVATLQLYLPDRDRFGTPVPDHSRWVQRAMHLLDTLEPGCTAQETTGMWRGSSERTTIVYKDVDATFFVRDLTPIRHFLEHFRSSTNQEAVYVALFLNGAKWLFSLANA